MSWNRRVFISHCWSYDTAYNTIKGWLDDAPYYTFTDGSITTDKALTGLTDEQLAQAIKERIRQCSIFVVPTGMYCNGSDWITFEVNTAAAMGKPILAVKPWGQEKNAKIVTDNATLIVGWNSSSVIDGIKKLTSTSYINK